MERLQNTKAGKDATMLAILFGLWLTVLKNGLPRAKRKDFTARWCNVPGREVVQVAIYDFLIRAGLPPLEITNVKIFAMI